MTDIRERLATAVVDDAQAGIFRCRRDVFTDPDLFERLAMEYAHDGIRVVATAPGGTQAPPRTVPRNPDGDDPREQAWMAEAVEQVTNSAFFGDMRRWTNRLRRSCSWPPTRPPTSPDQFCRSRAATWADRRHP